VWVVITQGTGSSSGGSGGGGGSTPLPVASTKPSR